MSKRAGHCESCNYSGHGLGIGRSIDGRYRPLCRICRFAAKVTRLLAGWRVVA